MKKKRKLFWKEIKKCRNECGKTSKNIIDVKGSKLTDEERQLE